MKPWGREKTPFTRAMWDRWLERFNLEPDAGLGAGVQEMRELLQARCLGQMRSCVDDTAEYRNFVVRTFGRAK